MTRREFMRACLVLPLMLPFLVAFAACLLAPFKLPISEGAAAIAVTLLMSMAVAGIPYSIFAAIAAFGLRHKSERAHHASAILAPVVFAAMLFVVWFVVGIATVGDVEQATTLGGYYAAMSLAYSIPCVALVYLLLWIFSRAGRIGPDGLPAVPWRSPHDG